MPAGKKTAEIKMDQKKNRIMMAELLVVAIAFIFVGAFTLNTFAPTKIVDSHPSDFGVVGFVPIEINNQKLDIWAEESSTFIIFTERENRFNLTSMRLSGTVIGDGRAEIYLEDGTDQRLLVYSNIKESTGNKITGMAVGGPGENIGADAEDESEAGKGWFMIIPDEGYPTLNPDSVVPAGFSIFSGKFDLSCVDTCYMNMKMQKGLLYSLRVRLDNGTKMHIDRLDYTLDV